MFDLAPSHFVLVALVALIVIGPKDLPKAMRLAGYWVGRARGIARQFRSGFDQMVREAELEELEKKWKAENERIMREHPLESIHDTGHEPGAAPVMTEKPVIVDHPEVTATAAVTAEPAVTAAPVATVGAPPPREASRDEAAS